jgi:OHCU decarboxylase
MSAAEPGLERLNTLRRDQAVAELLQCCRSQAWADTVADARPFASSEALLNTADAVWRALAAEDWLEAFRAHPRIGERAPDQQPPPGVTEERRDAAWSEQEQAAVRVGGAEALAELAALNRLYEQRFGHIFLICATGLGAADILEALRWRVDNDPAAELQIAAEEQRRITRIRLERLL